MNNNLYLWESPVVQSTKISENNNDNNKASSATNSKNPQNCEFNFNLPESNFASKELKINYIDYTKTPLAYHKSETNLNSAHFDEIRSEGIFRVRSNIRDFPYKFKISKLVITGRNEVKQNLNSDLGRALKIFDVLIGLKQFDLDKEENIIKNKELPKKFLEELRANTNRDSKLENSNNDSKFKLDLSIYSPEFRNKYSTLISNFDSDWRSKFEKYEQEIYQQNESIDKDEITEKLNEKYITSFISYINENKEILEGKHSLITDYIRAFGVYENIQKEYAQKKRHLLSTVEAEIINKHSIKSYNFNWVKDKALSQCEKELKKLAEEKVAKLRTELSSFPQPQMILLTYLRFKEENSVKEILKEKKEKNLLTIPLQELQLHRRLSQPFEVEKCEETYEDYYSKKVTKITYRLKKYDTIKVDTSKNFWRLRYLINCYFVTTSNIFRQCMENACSSTFGINALFKKEIPLEDEINPKTGEIKKKMTNETYQGSLIKLFNEIKKDREDFEKRTATGLFGKGVERIFNLSYNYVYKGMCKGFSLGIVYPVAIVGFSSFNFVLSLTSWIWSVGWIGLKYSWDALIYDTLSKEDNYFPLPGVIVSNFAIGSVLQSSLATLLATIQPTISLAISILGVIRFSLRSIYNFFMFQILKLNGRIPQTNTRLAWIISGPGISKNYYNYLSIPDSLVLVECELEKLLLLNYKREITEYLYDPVRQYQEIKKIINPLHLNFSVYLNNNINKKNNSDCNLNSNGEYDFGIETSVKLYEQMLNKQINERISIYPKTEKIKFTREELTLLRKEACAFIKNYVAAHKMEFVWNKFKLCSGSWMKLTDEVLKSAFSNSILESLEENDLRVEVLKLNQDDEDLEKSRLVEIKPDANQINRKNILKKQSEFYLNFYSEPFDVKLMNENDKI